MRKKFKIVIFLFILSITTIYKINAAAKYGVFIGINEYPNPNQKLGGCVNDAKKWKNFIKNEFGVSDSNSDILLDVQATRSNIINTIKKYQNKAVSGDVFIITYSGHGALFLDSKSEELDETEWIEVPSAGNPPDKYDSAICPIDSGETTSGKPWRNLILDDELYELFSVFLAKGAAVYFISDSCHSGSIARSLGGKQLNFETANNSEFKYRFASTFKLFNINSFDSIPKPTFQRTIIQRSVPGNLLLILAGSQDNQFSLDVNTPTGRQGLFTASFIEQYQQLKSAGIKPTFAQVMERTRPVVEEFSKNIPPIKPGFPVVPQIPRFDARFFCGELNAPMFSFPNCGSLATAPSLKVILKITDSNGTAINGGAIGLLKFGTNTNPNGITLEDVILLGRSDARGFYDSKDYKVIQGKYLIKVIKSGYKSFVQEVDIKESQNGTAILNFRLVKE